MYFECMYATRVQVHRGQKKLLVLLEMELIDSRDLTNMSAGNWYQII